MKNCIKINKVIFLLLLLQAVVGWGKVNKNPNWQLLIDSSIIIAEVEITKGGSFSVDAQIITLFKGGEVDEKITITGFSNKDGKMNHFTTGEKWLFFLKDKSLSNQFNVWSSTAGFLRIDKNKVQYDLLQASTHVLHEYYSLKFFRLFLEAAIRKSTNEKFHEKLLKITQSKILHDVASQYIMMLKLSGYATYHPFLFQTAYNQNINARVALARYLGGIPTQESRENLVSLLSSDEELVAEEAAIQLVNFNEDIVGEALLRRLFKTAKNNTLLSSNGTLSVIQTKIIESLVTLQYQPVFDTIATLLTTSNKHTFLFVLDKISLMPNNNYVKYFEVHFEKEHKHLYQTIFNHITTYKLKSGIKILTDFVSTCDKKTADYHGLVSSKGLGVFSDSLIIDFIISDFKLTVDTAIEQQNEINTSWLSSYFDFFLLVNTYNKEDVFRYIKHSTSINFNLLNSSEIFYNSIEKQDFTSFKNVSVFIDFLSKIGDINDLVLLHKIQSFYYFTDAQRQVIAPMIYEMEHRLSKRNL